MDSSLAEAQKALYSNMIIRPETPDDIKEIENVILAAFTGVFTDHPNEHLIVSGLRETGTLSLSLVAELDGHMVGHVAFSPVTINGEDTGWYGLGPISVLPGSQKQGIGSKLIQEGLSQIRKKGARGCVLTGSPGYYQRFGFRTYPNLYYEGVPDPKYFMALPFHEEIPAGKVEYHSAFYVQA